MKKVWGGAHVYTSKHIPKQLNEEVHMYMYSKLTECLEVVSQGPLHAGGTAAIIH